VAFPTVNIKDNAFIVGKVKEITKASDYQLAVIEYVESHDYGVSCTLIMKSEVNQGYGLGWEVWKDITKLDTQYNRPYWPYETIGNLNDLVKRVQLILASNKKLHGLWSPRNRVWLKVSQDSYSYFMIQKINNILLDAKDQLLEKDIHKANQSAINELAKTDFPPLTTTNAPLPKPS